MGALREGCKHVRKSYTSPSHFYFCPLAINQVRWVVLIDERKRETQIRTTESKEVKDYRPADVIYLFLFDWVKEQREYLEEKKKGGGN